MDEVREVRDQRHGIPERLLQQDRLPKLKLVTLDLERFRGGYTALGEKLLKAGADVTFDLTAVGCFTIKEPVAQPKLDFRFNTIASVWSHFSALPAESFDLHAPSPTLVHLQSTHERFTICVRHIFTVSTLRRSTTASPVLLSLGRRLPPLGFDLRWLAPDNQNPATFEKVTEKLLEQLGRILRRK